VSALLVPVVEIAARQDYQLLPSVPSLASDIRGDVVLLLGIATVTYLYFSKFDAPLLRTLADATNEDGEGVIDNESAKENGEVGKSNLIG
jgi:hypothetical protein